MGDFFQQQAGFTGGVVPGGGGGLGNILPTLAGIIGGGVSDPIENQDIPGSGNIEAPVQPGLGFGPAAFTDVTLAATPSINGTMPGVAPSPGDVRQIQDEVRESHLKTQCKKKRRKMNPLNISALKRSMTRAKSFSRIAQSVLCDLQDLAPKAPPKRRAPAKKRC